MASHHFETESVPVIGLGVRFQETFPTESMKEWRKRTNFRLSNFSNVTDNLGLNIVFDGDRISSWRLYGVESNDF